MNTLKGEKKEMTERLNDRLKILSEIDRLEDKFCISCQVKRDVTNKYCTTKCKIGAELISLGDRLIDDSHVKTSQMLKKGDNLTWNEIEMLIDKGIPRKRIAVALGIGRQAFAARLDNHRNYKRKGEAI